MSKLNIELFKKVRDRIATIPESYDQEQWYDTSPRSPCGTVACLAGEAIICAAKSVPQGIAELKRLYARDPLYAVPERAARLLGLSGDWSAWIDEEDWKQAAETTMFDADAETWPEPYRDEFQRAPSAIERASVAVAYLDRIIETGKVLE